MSNYFVNSKEITGVLKNPQTLLFADLTDDEGNALPSFITAPYVSGFSLDGGNCVMWDVDTVGFKIVVDLGPNLESYTTNILISDG